MKLRADDWWRIMVLTLISAPAIAFMAFDYVFPNISTPSLEKNLLVAFLLSTVFGMPTGYMTQKTNVAMITVVVYIFVGYAVAILAYSAPFLFYDFGVVFPDLYVLFFLKMTVIPLMLFFMGGIVGMILGQLLRESAEREETSQVFSKLRP